MSMRRSTRSDFAVGEWSGRMGGNTDRPVRGQDQGPFSQGSGVRLERVEALREAIAKGTYRVSTEHLANCLIRRMLQSR